MLKMKFATKVRSAAAASTHMSNLSNFDTGLPATKLVYPKTVKYYYIKFPLLNSTRLRPSALIAGG